MSCKPEVSASDFVKIWEDSLSLGEVAKKLNITTSRASTRASIYRNRGVHLKNMHQKIDVDNLNAVIAKHNKTKH